MRSVLKFRNRHCNMQSCKESSPQVGNLTGTPRKIRDNCAELYNQIQRWNQLNVDGLKIIQQIVDLKLSEQEHSGQETAEESASIKPNLPRPKLQELCDVLQEIFDKMVERVEMMQQLTELFEQVVSLWNFQKDFQQVASPGGESGLPFLTWPVENFVNVSRAFSESYAQELGSKRTVMESIAHVSGKEERLFLMAVWAHEPHLQPRLKLFLEAMLTEVKLR